MIISDFSAGVSSYASAGTVLILSIVVPLYGKLADRVPRRRLINIVTMIFAACLVLFYVLGQAGLSLGIVYFVWLSIFSVMLIAQFWAFANDIYTREEGERLFPIVALGQTLGPILGSLVVLSLVAPLGTYSLMLVAAALLVAQVQVTNPIDTRERRLKEAKLPDQETTAILTATSTISLAEIHDRLAAFQGTEDVPLDATFDDAPEEQAPEPTDSEENTGTGAFALVFRTRYLLLMGLLLMVLNFVNTNGGYILNAVVEEVTARDFAAGATGGLNLTDYTTQFYGAYNLGISILTALIQLFFVSRIVKYLGVAVGLMILPVISLGAYSVIAFFPVLQYLRWAKTVENATDYSLQNTVRNMLFLPTTREQQYKAKQTIDSFFVRSGDLLSSVLVLASATVLGLTTTGFSMFNIGLVVVWLGLAFVVGKDYKRLVATGETPQ